MDKRKIVTIEDIDHSFCSQNDNPTKILENINFTLYEKEIVGLLGKSGSGKSTILRILANLIEPTAGKISYYGNTATDEQHKISMVFQNFAIFPWLTVLENIELGMEYKNIPKKIKREKAINALNLIGLDGYEDKYPKEISGGMKQRVGLARALAVEPEILLMDEPFSALDILIGEVLKTDLLDLWIEKITSIKSILIVTHNIEEAVFLCDRVMILSSNPGKIIAEVQINLPHPRDRISPEFNQYIDYIYELMTINLKSKIDDINIIKNVTSEKIDAILKQLLESPFNSRADLPSLARAFNISPDELFPLVAVLELLEFADLKSGDIHLTAAARLYLKGSDNERKIIFGRHLIEYMPVVSYIRRLLKIKNNIINKQDLISNLNNKFKINTDLELLQTIVSWGEYGELFKFDETCKNIIIIG